MNLSAFFQLDSLLYRVAAFLLAAAVHDFAHSLAALSLGDRTAREQGRLTLNPLPHLDVLGLSMLLFGPYGWTRTIPVQGERLRSPRRGSLLLVYLSGPLANLLLGILFWWLYFTVPALVMQEGKSGWSNQLLEGLIHYAFIVNILYFLIHIIPVYPLDGWFVLKNWLPAKAKRAIEKKERFGLILVIALLVTPIGELALELGYQKVTQLIMDLFALGS